MTYILAFLAGMFFEAAGTFADKGRKVDALTLFIMSAVLVVTLVFII